ncbi:MAG: molybdopterin-guanine dinucleotide biosynthesis protein A-like protein, partial [Firmicutes bacterium]|nr:molybdopterin-guanine dinucleotide biosynthesis protein A-like protein [Bacillota bacterium]
MTEKFTGIVLAGGLSTRMGRDKASLPWAGTNLLHTVLNALVPVCQQIIVVTNIVRVISVPGVIVVSDEYRGCGALGGIHAGLKASANEYNFIVACDMPFVQAPAVEYMMQCAAGYDVVVPYIDKRYHPLHAIYNRRCLPYFQMMLDRGCYRIISLFENLKIRLVEKSELAAFDSSCIML